MSENILACDDFGLWAFSIYIWRSDASSCILFVQNTSVQSSMDARPRSGNQRRGGRGDL